MILLFLTHSISDQKPEEVGHSGEGILQNLDPPIGEGVEINKGVTEVAALDDLLGGQIDIQKLVECHDSHVEDRAIDHHKRIVAKQNFIGIVAVQVGDIFNLDIFLNSHTWGIVIDSQGDAAVVSVADQSHEAVVAANLDVFEVVRGAELFLGDVVFRGDGDVRAGRAVEHEVIAWMEW